jgi:hypothetical protein
MSAFITRLTFASRTNSASQEQGNKGRFLSLLLSAFSAMAA